MQMAVLLDELKSKWTFSMARIAQLQSLDELDIMRTTMWLGGLRIYILTRFMGYELLGSSAESRETFRWRMAEKDDTTWEPCIWNEWFYKHCILSSSNNKKDELELLIIILRLSWKSSILIKVTNYRY